MTGYNRQEEALKNAKARKRILIIDTLLVALSILIMAMALFLPTVEVKSPVKWLEEYTQTIEEIGKDETLVEKFINGSEEYNKWHKDTIPLAQVIEEIYNNCAEECGENGECAIGLGEFSIYILKYSLFGGSERMIFSEFGWQLCFPTVAGMLLIYIIVLLAMLITKGKALKLNPKDNPSYGKAEKGYWGAIVPYILILSISIIFRQLSVFASYPVYSAYMLLFNLAPLFYVFLVIECALILTHISLRIISRSYR